MPFLTHFVLIRKKTCINFNNSHTKKKFFLRMILDLLFLKLVLYACKLRIIFVFMSARAKSHRDYVLPANKPGLRIIIRCLKIVQTPNVERQSMAAAESNNINDRS